MRENGTAQWFLTTFGIVWPIPTIKEFLAIECMCMMAAAALLVLPPVRMQVDGIPITGAVIEMDDGGLAVQDPATELTYRAAIGWSPRLGDTATLIVHPTSPTTVLTPTMTYVYTLTLVAAATLCAGGWPVCWWVSRRRQRIEPSSPTSDLCTATSQVALYLILAVMVAPAFAPEPAHAYDGDAGIAIMSGGFLSVALATNRSWRRPDRALATSFVTALLTLATTIGWVLEAA